MFRSQIHPVISVRGENEFRQQIPSAEFSQYISVLVVVLYVVLY